MKKGITHLLILTLWLSSAKSLGQTPAQQPGTQREEKIVVGTAEVQLDVVVKDKKGRVVRDLKAADFEVYEDGVKQQVESFRLVTRRELEGGAGSTPSSSGESPITPVAASGLKSTRVISDAESGVSAVALVFDRLSPDARKRAMDSALSYVGTAEKLESFVGVFTVNLSLGTVQNYTKDAVLIRSAVERAGSMASASFGSGTTASEGSRQQQMASQSVANAGVGAAQAAGAAGNAAGAAAAGAAIGAASVEQKFAEMQERTAETFDVLQRDQQGYATTNSLLALINAMKLLPGRKAVIFFSESVPLPPNVRSHFRSVINNANRANVSVYTVDAAGLRIDSPLQVSRDEINARSRRRMESLDRVQLGAPMTAALERNEDILKMNPQSGLSDLAQETGGVFIGDTNNIGPRLRQVDEDLNTYYLLSYTPTSQNYDGSFRKISLKVNRSGTDVLSRKGYFAVPATGGSPVLFYETPGLVALNLVTLNNAASLRPFPVQLNALNFPEPESPGRVTVSVQVPSGAFTFIENKEKKSFSTDFSIVVLLKDSAKQVVSKLSQHYILTGAVDKMEATKKGTVLFYRETTLPPGNYSVEVVAHDLPAGKSSVNRSSLEVSEGDAARLRLSSVAIIQKVEPLDGNKKTGNPFEVGEMMIYPNLGEPVKKSAGKMGFFFTVYPVKGDTVKPRLTLEILQGARSFANVPLKLNPPDDKGRIQYASALPLDSLQAGSYELRISVSDARGTVTRSTPFTLEP